MALVLMAGMSSSASSLMAQTATASARGLEASLGSPAAFVQTPSLPGSTCTLVASTRSCDLWAKAGTLTLPAGSTPASVSIWGFAESADADPTTPGPTIVAGIGETLSVTLHNTLAQDASLAFPGQSGAPDTTGVATGDSKTYNVDLDHAGTFLYEAGLTANGPRQVAMGMHGVLVVRPATASQVYGAGTGFDDEAVEVISSVDPAFNAAPESYDLTAYAPKFWLLNGRGFPETATIDTVGGHRLSLRYANAGLSAVSMGLLGISQTKVGQDARPDAFRHRVVAETIPPGGTLDTIVDVPAATPDGTQFALFEQSGRLDNGGKRTGAIVDFGGALTFVNVAAAAPAPAPADLVFASMFESGNLTQWSASSGGASRISVSPVAALSGEFGLRTRISGNTPSYVADNRPANQASSHIRFRFDPNGTATAGAATTILLGRNARGATVFRIQYRKSGRLLQVRAQVERAGGRTNTSWQSITDNKHAIEIAWRSATRASFSLWIDGKRKQTLTGVNTSSFRLEQVRMGPSAGLTATTRGSEYYDDYAMTRTSYIG
jgi:FtsP/CotA-like multicopper oxidase with cupredoxin domain